MCKASHAEKQDLGVYIPSENRESSQSINVYHWTRYLLNEIEWFPLEGILEHSAFHANGDNIIFNLLLKLSHMFSIRVWKYGG